MTGFQASEANPERESFVSSAAMPSTIRAARAPGGAVIATLCMTMLFGLSGCVLAPVGALEEQAKLDSVAPAFEPPVDARQLPTLPTRTGWREVLRRAFFAN